MAGFEDTFEFSQGGQILLAASGALRQDETRKAERSDAAPERFHCDRVLLDIGKYSEAGHLGQEIDLTDIRL